MTIEAGLAVVLNEKTFSLAVKMIRIDSVNYFFVRDDKDGGNLLNGKILELTYRDSFSLTKFDGQLRSPGIPRDIIDVIQQALLQNDQPWFS